MAGDKDSMLPIWYVMYPDGSDDCTFTVEVWRDDKGETTAPMGYRLEVYYNESQARCRGAELLIDNSAAINAPVEPVEG